MARSIKNIVIHCADTPNGKHFTVEDIDAWHRERGWKRTQAWRDALNPSLTSIGYQFVIYEDGQTRTGRHCDEVPAAVSGANSDSINICLIGKDKFTKYQWESLKELLEKLMLTYPGVAIKGHYEFPSAIVQGKKCPNFDVSSYVADGFVPDDKNILED